MWRRFFKLLFYIILALYIASAATFIAVLHNPEWHVWLLRFSWRVWQAFLGHVGSTGPGFISPIILSILSVVLTMVCIGVMQSWDAMLKHWWETALVTGVVLVTTMLAVYGPQFIWQAVKLAEQDSQQSTASASAVVGLNGQLKDAKQNAEQQCEQAKDHEINRLKRQLNASCFRPDRHLTREDRAVIFAGLQQVAEEQKKKNVAPSIHLLCGCQDLETSRFVNDELWPIFRNAGWTMRIDMPSEKLTKEQIEKNFESERAWIYQAGFAEGITVFDKDSKGFGWSLSMPFYERGYGGMWDQRHTELPNVDGLTIWIGYKSTR